MAEPVPLSELSDIELTGLLRAGFVPGGSSTWTVGQLIEVEKRGTACLESDPELRQAVDEYLLDWTERFRTAYQAAMPTLDTSGLLDTLGALGTSKKLLDTLDTLDTLDALGTSKKLLDTLDALGVSKKFPKYDVSKLFPAVDTSKLFPIYEEPEQIPKTTGDVGVDDHFGEDIGDLPIEE